jgi:hypothetical protein
LKNLNLAYALVIFSIMGLVIPAYAQDARYTELEQQMREEVRDCKVKIDAQDELSDAEKTVAKRNCETAVVIRYGEIEDNYTQAEIRDKIQNMQRCEDWYPQYRYLTEAQFTIQKKAEVVRDCFLLYNDPIWSYDGKDRLNKLIDRLDEIKSELPTISEPVRTFEAFAVPQYEPSIIDVPHNQDRVVELEEKVKILEEEIAKKDEVIQEQIKVIMDMYNRIRNVIFETIGFVWSQA